MPIPSYSVLAGDPTGGKVVPGKGAHYQITMQAPGGPFTAAVNIESVDGSDVLYAILENFTPPDLADLQKLPMGITKLKSQPGGLALDFVRSQVNGNAMITEQQMTLLPKPLKGKEAQELSPQEKMIREARTKALQNAVVTLLNMTIADKEGVIYAFGSAFADGGKVDGIHDIHMNQGNPKGNHSGDNGSWQDGGLFIHLPSQNKWTAVFIAFQTETWETDGSGNPD
jgi:uncharacterized protein YukJ